jgi:hypothetical protein
VTSVDHVAGPTAADLGLVPPRWTRRVDPLARRLFPLAVVVGVAARVAISRRGSNYDFDSWTLVPDILDAGGNIYAAPEMNGRYAYGPVWFLLLHALDGVAGWLDGSSITYRHLIIGVLTLGDLALACVLARQCGWFAAWVAFLNPVSIVIAGYHNQFDALGIAVSLAGIGILARGDRGDAVGDTARSSPPDVGGTTVAGVLLLGLGLVTKHALFVFPLWLAMRGGSMKRRMVLLAGAPAVFLASFAPWLESREAIEGVVNRVFRHPGGRAGLVRELLDAPQSGGRFALSFVVWLAVLVWFGWLLRRAPIMTSAIVFLLANLAFAPGFANQHIVLGVAAAAVLLAPELLIAMALGSLLVLQNSDGAHFQFFLPGWFELEGHMYAWIQAVLWVWFARLGWRVWRVRRAGVGGRGRHSRRVGIGSRARGVSGAGA